MSYHVADVSVHLVGGQYVDVLDAGLWRRVKHRAEKHEDDGSHRGDNQRSRAGEGQQREGLRPLPLKRASMHQIRRSVHFQ